MPGGGGFIGKVWDRGDFVRFGAGAEQGGGLFDLLEATNELVRSGGVRWSDEVLRVWLPVQGLGLVAGAIRPLQDRVGRQFPSALFTRCPEGVGVPALVAGAGAQVEAAARQLAEMAGDLPPDVDEAVAAVGEVEAGAALERAAALQAEASRTGVLAALGPLLGAATPEVLAYALRTAARGARQGGAEADPQRAVVLLCPARSPLEAWFWSELVSRASSGGRLAAAWRREEGRLLLAPAGLTASLLELLVRPSAAAPQRVWPLVTSRDEAHEEALTELTGPQRDLVGAAGSSLLDALKLFGG